ncbi:hypothetical protein BU25DRAFT_441797 [Macroventuria anomochaeta]|uniref:Uncharacterized protein n=1 Tax=Macroventuria anomochaeta TaxID=301207 RepID=A0ACB6RRY0_9PLEO|nr:uncharacterized protein BU25DRAFT_441797 [Macroventuria anomochaeta]KAF2624720.1 hypothetical protein BU25DRAFT_441797 [Macroventuria anomochaeta]
MRTTRTRASRSPRRSRRRRATDNSRTIRIAQVYKQLCAVSLIITTHHHEAKVLFQLGARCKIPSKMDAAKEKTPEPTPAQSQPQRESQSHRRHHLKDDFPHLAAHISRQSLDAQTERELRVACRLILQNFKPSDHGMEDTDPRLDFGAMNRRRGEQQNAVLGANEVRVRMPTGAPVDLKTALEARRLRAEAEVKKNPQSTLPVRTRSARQRFDDAFADERGRSATKKYVTAKPPSAETVQRGRSQRTRTESGDADSLATPMTGSTTDAYFNHASTAPSSAALTSSGTSNRHSRQLEPAAIADAQAAEWMRKELEKRRQQNDSPQQPPPTTNRPPSRARSIKENIKEYIFPGSTSISRAPSRALSRTQSRESLALYDDDGEPRRNGSQRGWRSWGSALRVNSRSNSRPGTRGRDAEAEQPKKSEVNLNRELPPLPSLDSWKDEVKPQPELSSSHIASVMRAHDKQQGPFSPTRSNHRRSGSDTLAVQYAQAYPQSPSHSHRSPMYNKQKVDSKKNSPRPDQGEISQVMTGWSSTGNLAPRNGHVRHQSTDNSSPGKMSMDQNNFSRKISMDTPDHHAFPSAVKLQKNQQQSRLKKVFSGWMLKKEKKEDWMHKIEKEGVKEGVLVQEGGAHVPVVRY